jgi:ketosteroid isomerase-like protein
MKNVALLPTIILLLACTQVENAVSDVKSIRAQLMEIAEMSARDQPTAAMTDAYMKYFAAEPALLPANGKTIYGRAAIAHFYNDAFAGIKILSNRYEDPVIVVNGSFAARRYLGTAVSNISGQQNSVTARNRYIDVLVKEDDEWKVLWHLWVPISWD